MNGRLKRLIVINLLIIGAVVAFIVISYVTAELGISQCKFLEKFHMYCLGCGGTRAVYSLLRLRIIDSFLYNPIVPLGFTLYIYYNLRALIAIKRKDESYFAKQKNVLIPIFISIALLYLIFRNVLLIFGTDIIGDVFGNGVIQ